MKTTIFVVVAIAVLAVVGATTAIMSSASTVHAVTCHKGNGAQVCPPGATNNPSENNAPFVCKPPGLTNCRNIGPPS